MSTLEAILIDAQKENTDLVTKINEQRREQKNLIESINLSR